MSNLKHSKSPGTQSLALDRQALIDWNTLVWNKPDISMPPWLACWRKFWNMSRISCNFNRVSTRFGISIFQVFITKYRLSGLNINITYPCTSDFPITPKVSEWSAGYIILNTIVFTLEYRVPTEIWEVNSLTFPDQLWPFLLTQFLAYLENLWDFQT